MDHAVGGLISWALAGVPGALIAWGLKEWGREVLFGHRDRGKSGGSDS